MKTRFSLKFSSLEVKRGDQVLNLGEGTALEVETEYSAEEVIENIKSLPQLISVLKESTVEIAEAFTKFQRGETENACMREDNRVANEIKEGNAEFERNHRT